MNPEFQRNIWLELTPLRLVILIALLLLAFFSAAVTEGFTGPGTVARWLFDFIVVIWGTRNAARSVIGEIHDRTWDNQRLSSLHASTMMWGKLFGSTVFNWAGGGICLIVIVAEAINRDGAAAAIAELIYFVALGVIAQSASLLASLIAAGRRQGRTQFEVFFYQIVGIATALVVAVIADPTSSGFGVISRADTMLWWGCVLPTEPFFLASLAAFAGWILLGVYRRMRLELKLRNGPFVWLAFLAFSALYIGGFDAWVLNQLPHADTLARRLYLAVMACSILAYMNVILEPKNRVFFRWLGSEISRFHIGTALARFQCWMMSFLAALVLGGTLIAHLVSSGRVSDQAMVAAFLGFLSRDMGIVVLMNMAARRRSGDLLSLAVLVLLYGLMPSIINGLQYGTGQALFLPRMTDPTWLSPAVSWFEAALVWTIAVVRISLRENTPH